MRFVFVREANAWHFDVGRKGIFNIVKATFKKNIPKGFKDNVFFIASEGLVGV
jgi:hypothetical protein